MARIGYQALGFAVWKAIKGYLGLRFGDAPRKVALGGVLLAVVAALLFAGKRATAD
jgi:membrane protein DedA with SNARE-associated domain